jgi:hypothetical protein
MTGDNSGFGLARLGSRIPKQGATSFAASKLRAIPSAYGAAKSWPLRLRRDLDKSVQSQTPHDCNASMKAVELNSCQACSCPLSFCGCQPQRADLYAEALSVH